MAASTASECPNCYTDNDDETDCPHLLAGDDCPNCGTEMEKPRAGKVECPNCEWVVNGAVEFQDSSGKAIVTFPSEADARGAADAILDCNGIEDEAAHVGMR